MKPQDYYTPWELRWRIIRGKVTAWWVRDGDKAVGWCALYWDDHEEWPNAICLLGVAVAPEYRQTKLVLRLLRHLFKQTGDHPVTTYIQPGVATERLLPVFGFRFVKPHGTWNMYVREARK